MEGVVIDWRSIEELPEALKDGRWLLGFDADSEGCPFGPIRWKKDEWEDWEQTNANTKKRVVRDASYWESETGIAPTHFAQINPPK